MSQIKDSMVPYITEKEIRDLVTKLAKQIESEYAGEEVIFVCPLQGSILFVADLMRAINLKQQVDFVKLSNVSEDGRSGGTIKIVKDISHDITNKNVIIIEEIIDTGRTLNFLKNRLLASGPKSLRIVTLLDKPARRVINIKPDYIGKTIDDRFVVGYGMDDDQLGRNYREIYYLKH